MQRHNELDELQELARAATFKALRDYEPPQDEWLNHLTLGVFIEDEHRVFKLYVPQERPEEAIVISSARVDRVTKSVQVTIFNLTRRPGDSAEP